MTYSSDAGREAAGMKAEGDKIRYGTRQHIGERTITRPTGSMLTMIASMQALGLAGEDNDDTLRKVHSAALATAAVLQLYEGVVQARKMLKAREAAKAAAETAAHVAAQDYAGIALATAAAATVMTTFSMGYVLGSQDEETETSHESTPNVGSSAGRREVSYTTEDDEDW